MIGATMGKLRGLSATVSEVTQLEVTLKTLLLQTSNRSLVFALTT